MPEHRFPPPCSFEEPDLKLDRPCYIIRDANGQALAYVYFEKEPRRRFRRELLTLDKGAAHRRGAGAPAGCAQPGWCSSMRVCCRAAEGVQHELKPFREAA